jgi:hypothetical protein
MKANSPAVLHALDAIFDIHAVADADGSIRVTLPKAVTHSQFSDLVGLSQYLQNYPAVVRSGAGVSVIFSC